MSKENGILSSRQNSSSSWVANSSYTYKHKTLCLCAVTIISQKFEIPDDLQTISNHTRRPVSATQTQTQHSGSAYTTNGQRLNDTDRECRVMNCGHRNKVGEEGKGGQAQDNTQSLQTSGSLPFGYHDEAVTTLPKFMVMHCALEHNSKI
jgi:hypothetical protein